MYTLTIDYNQNSVRTVQMFLQKNDPSGLHLITNSGREALEFAREQVFNVVFLETVLPDMSGLEVARHLKRLQPETDLVFITSTTEYAVQAFELYACGYLIKPVRESQLRETIANLRHMLPFPKQKSEKSISVRCFGVFEVWYEGEPVQFRFEETRQLLALLVDRNGALTGRKELAEILIGEEEESDLTVDPIRLWIADLQTTFTMLGQGDVVMRKGEFVGLDTDMLDCDYYRFLSGDASGDSRFRGEYMSQYSFDKNALSVLEGMRKESKTAPVPESAG